MSAASDGAWGALPWGGEPAFCAHHAKSAHGEVPGLDHWRLAVRPRKQIWQEGQDGKAGQMRTGIGFGSSPRGQRFVAVSPSNHRRLQQKLKIDGSGQTGVRLESSNV